LAGAAHSGEPDCETFMHVRILGELSGGVAAEAAIRGEVDSALAFSIPLPPPAAGALLFPRFHGARARGASDAGITAGVERVQWDIVESDVVVYFSGGPVGERVELDAPIEL